MDYRFYAAEDFAADEFFILWVKHPTEDSNAFWNAWISKHPEQAHSIQKARRMVLTLDFKEIEPPEGKFLEIWQKINDQDNQRAIAFTPEKQPAVNANRKWYRLAAASILLCAIAAAYLIYWNSSVIIRTRFGESRSFLLPDSTKVVLNANSTIRYDADFETKREVWLSGEGFFIVKHKDNNQNFRVQTEDIQIEVLGTRFNVNTRRGRSQVVVEEGKVKLDVDLKVDDPSLIMLPGDFAEVSKTSKRVNRKVVDVSNYSSWRLNKLIFVSTPLEEIASLLEDNYGYHVEFENESLRELPFTGSASVDNPAELLQTLGKVFDITIRQEGRTLEIQQKE